MKDISKQREVWSIIYVLTILFYSFLSSQVYGLCCRNIASVCKDRRRFLSIHNGRSGSSIRLVPLSLSDELGISGGIFGNKLFDPLQLATDENFVRYREAELKHARVAMLATIGFILPEIIDTENAIIANKLLGLIGQPSLKTVPVGIHFVEIPIAGWLPMIALTAILELFILKQRNKMALPGDYGTGFLGLHDYGKHEKLLQRELEYGRLAMIGFLLQVIWELSTNTSVVDPYRNLITYAIGKF